MSIGVLFENRSFAAYPHVHWDNIEVQRYSKNVIGGPKKATLIATGSELDLWEFVEMIRYAVQLVDNDQAKPVWWGYIAKVTIKTESGLQYGVSIDSMANKIAIAYTYNKERVTTVWDNDTTSQTEFGIKQMLVSAHEKDSRAGSTISRCRISTAQISCPCFPHIWKPASCGRG